MGETEPTKSRGWLDALLESPFLFPALLAIFGILVVTVGLVLYFALFNAETGFNPTPIPTTSVQFGTPTPPRASTDTSSSTGPSPSIVLIPVRGDSGILVTVTGNNWTPRDTVVVRLDDPSGNQVVQPIFANAQVADNGSFIASFILQANTGWQNLDSTLATVDLPATGERVSAEFSLVSTSPIPTPIPQVTTPPAAQPTATPIPLPGEIPTPTTQYIPSPGDWAAQYYGNPTLVGSPILARNELGIDFDWGSYAPAATLPVDGFSARWTRSYDLGPGVYRFHIVADDAVRLWLNEELVADEWFASAPRDIVVDYSVFYRGYQDVRVEYADFAAGAKITFWWEKLAIPPGSSAPPGGQWQSQYWPNANLFGDPAITGIDPAVNFNWGNGSPGGGVPNDNFSARWIRLADFESSNYRFLLTVSDGARLWLDGELIIDEWRDGNTRQVSQDFLVVGGRHELWLEYYERTGEAVISLRWEKVGLATATPTPTPIAYYPDWQAEYWSNIALSGDPALVRNDPTINFNWGPIAAAPGLPPDNFSVRWSRSFNFENALYRFTANVNDGIRFYVDGSLVLNQWSDTPVVNTHTLDLNLNGRHWLIVEYYERTGDAVVKFDWQQMSPTETPTPTPTPPPTNTPLPTSTSTATSSPTSTQTPSPTASPTSTFTPTVIPLPTETLTPTVTVTATGIAVTPTMTSTVPSP